MRNVFRRLTERGRSDGAVLIQGERGSGRRFVAREIHTRSRRKQRPFVSHDCCRQDPLALRRVLFGEIRELGPGHYLKYLGLLEEVQDGTLYLEAIEDLPQEVQGKLRRVLRRGRFSPIGSDRDVKFRGRIIASSDMDLEERVEDGRFDGDLFDHFAAQGVRVELRRSVAPPDEG